MITKFFDTNSYFIDEKVNFFKFENAYRVYDENAREIGSVRQKLTAGQKMLRLLLNKAMLPFLLEIRDADEQLQASVSRGWTFFMSKIVIKNNEGQYAGRIQQKFKFFKPTFKIFDANEQQIAEITGDWKAWNFVIKDNSGTQIGAINKKWAGVAKELFTSADKYNVSIEPGYSNAQNKTTILAAAITIDMVLKESK